MAAERKIRKILKSNPTLEGAGVHLRRVFGFDEAPLFDPFLLLDDFRSDNPDHYLKGFPWHPHRGIETITYVLKGDVEHGDSLGNKGVIGSGDVQWMTAGSGIIHQEMPKGDGKGSMHGFQLWANLPAGSKMMDPRYQDLASDRIPEVRLSDGVTLKVIAGKAAGIEGPVKDIVIDPEVIDVTVPAGCEFRHATKKGYTVFTYIIGGEGYFCKEKAPVMGNGTLLLFEDGEEVQVITEDREVKFLLVSGKPIGEPVAWQGPIVMNTAEEIEIAFAEYRQGTFIKFTG